MDNLPFFFLNLSLSTGKYVTVTNLKRVDCIDVKRKYFCKVQCFELYLLSFFVSDITNITGIHFDTWRKSLLYDALHGFRLGTSSSRSAGLPTKVSPATRSSESDGRSDVTDSLDCPDKFRLP